MFTSARPLRLILFLVLAGATAASGLAAAALSPREWSVDGVRRQALIHIPAGRSKTPAPVVFVFHGHGGSMAHASRAMGLHALWPEAIIVYPQGLPTSGMTDPEGKLPGWQKSPGDYADRDLKFFDAMLASLEKDHSVDRARVYSTGHSNGGQFTYLLWATRGDRLAAVAPSAAAPGLAWVRQLKPKPALHVAGTQDELVKFSWQERSMEFVRRLNGVAATGEPWAKSGPITGTLYASKTGTPFVSLIYPGNHRYPAEAPALIVRFFQSQPGR